MCMGHKKSTLLYKEATFSRADCQDDSGFKLPRVKKNFCHFLFSFERVWICQNPLSRTPSTKSQRRPRKSSLSTLEPCTADEILTHSVKSENGQPLSKKALKKLQKEKEKADRKAATAAKLAEEKAAREANNVVSDFAIEWGTWRELIRVWH